MIPYPNAANFRIIYPFRPLPVQCRRRPDDVTQLQRGDSDVDNHLAHALCQGSRGPLPRRNSQAIRPMPAPASVRSSILALQPSPSAQRLAPGASRQTRGFTNPSLISSPGAILSSTSCLHARAKIRRHALNAQSFSCNMLFRMGLCDSLIRHISWWTYTCFFTFRSIETSCTQVARTK